MYGDGFRYPSEQRKHKRRAKAVTGVVRSNKLSGAPEPSRDVFVYRVKKNTQADDIRDYMDDQGICVRDIKKISHEDAMFDSFKVELKMADLTAVVNAQFWPEGVNVRRFFKPRNPEY